MHKSKILKLQIVLLIFLIFISSFSHIYAEENSSNTSDTANALQMHSNDAVLLDYQSGAVLYAKNAYNKVYPASTTKILTAIIAIEHLNLADTLVASKNAIYSMPNGSSSSYIRIGESLTVDQLLYCLLLQSGNDAANVLAEAVSGKISDFVALMNQKAVEIGCKGSHFTNAHGFHDDNHYSTPYDMAIIMQYAMINQNFRKICETKSYVINETNKTNEKRYLKNTNKMLFNSSSSTSSVYYEYAVGGKTGYTEEARGTFVGYATKGDSTVITAVFDGSQNISGLEARFLDSITLYNYSFNTYSKSTIIDKSKFYVEIIDRQNSKKYRLELKENIDSLNDKSFYDVNYTTNVDLVKLNSKMLQNEAIGTVSFNVNSKNWNLSNTYDLILVKSESFIDFGKIFGIAIKPALIIILLIMLLIIYIKIKNGNIPHGTVKSRSHITKKRENRPGTKRINYSSTLTKDGHRNGYKNIRF